MAEERGDFELFGAPAAQEKSEVSDEVFQDMMRQVQQQIARIRQEEATARGYDWDLAAILVQFLSQPQNTDLFLLISKVIAQDVPSDVILAIISLIDQRATEAVKGLLKSATASEQKALVLQKSASFEALPPEHKKRIDEWVRHIDGTCNRRPHRMLSSIVVQVRLPDGQAGGPHDQMVRQISPVLIQLSAFVLQKYLNAFRGAFDFDQIHAFMQTVWVEIVKKLASMLEGQKRIKGAS